MASNRLSRDEIILQALRMAEVPDLNRTDVSNGNPYTGTVNTAARCVEWLQRAVDLFHAQFPWAGIVTSTPRTFTAAVNTVALPTDFILDVRNGLLITVGTTVRRLRRRGFQNLLTASLNQPTGAPKVYCVQGSTFLVAPTPDQGYTGTLWYYQLPAVLTSTTVPNFPSDQVLIEYLRIRAMELIRAVPPGAAVAYAESRIAILRKSGLAHEPEDEDIPFDEYVTLRGAGGQAYESWSWMGEIGA